MSYGDHLTDDERQFLEIANKYIAKDLASPQSLTPDEEITFTELEREFPEPAEIGEEDQAFEAYLRMLENKRAKNN